MAAAGHFRNKPNQIWHILKIDVFRNFEILSSFLPKLKFEISKMQILITKTITLTHQVNRPLAAHQSAVVVVVL